MTGVQTCALPIWLWRAGKTTSPSYSLCWLETEWKKYVFIIFGNIAIGNQILIFFIKWSAEFLDLGCCTKLMRVFLHVYLFLSLFSHRVTTTSTGGPMRVGSTRCAHLLSSTKPPTPNIHTLTHNWSKTHDDYNHTHTHHVYITSGDITLTCMHFLETYPNLNHNQHMPNPNPNPNPYPYPYQVFTLKLMIPLMGTKWRSTWGESLILRWRLG